MFNVVWSTVAERAQRAANRKNICKLRKPLPKFYNAHAANAHNTTKKRNTLQIEKNTCKLRKHFRQFDNAQAANVHNTTKKETCCKYLVVLWAFAVCFFICLCCDHLHHLLSKWRKCFLDMLVLFLFACVFWSCSGLSSLGHRIDHYLLGY